jgi:hypothetical protein
MCILGHVKNAAIARVFLYTAKCTEKYMCNRYFKHIEFLLTIDHTTEMRSTFSKGYMENLKLKL